MFVGAEMVDISDILFIFLLLCDFLFWFLLSDQKVYVSHL